MLQIKDLKILENAGKSRIFQCFEQHISATRKDFSDFPKDSERSWAETSISGTFTARKNPCTFSPRFQITVIRFFLKKHRFFVCRFENKRFYFFGAKSTIFERFRSSAFQNTKNYHLTPKTRGDTTICVEPTTPGPHYSRQPRRGNRSSKNRLCKPLKVL